MNVLACRQLRPLLRDGLTCVSLNVAVLVPARFVCLCLNTQPLGKGLKRASKRDFGVCTGSVDWLPVSR